MESEKKKRERGQNWDNQEKILLRHLVAKHSEAVETKECDYNSILKKRIAWETIAKGLRAAGFKRNAKNAKDQWRRIKSLSRAKDRIKKTFNIVDPTKLISEDTYDQSFDSDDSSDSSQSSLSVRKLLYNSNVNLSLPSESDEHQNFNESTSMETTVQIGNQISNADSEMQAFEFCKEETLNEKPNLLHGLEKMKHKKSCLEDTLNEREEQIAQKKRDREQNWDRKEKKLLRYLVSQNIEVIESRVNDTPMVRRKQAAWEKVHKGLLAAGYYRSTKKARDQWSRLKLQARKKEKASKSTLKVVDMKTLLPTHEKQSVEDPLQESFLENIKEDSLHIDDNSQTSIQASESYVSNDSDSIRSFRNDHTNNIENSALTSSDIVVNSDANDEPDSIDKSAASDDLVNLENSEFVKKFSIPEISILENTTGETAGTSRIISKHKNLIRSIKKLSDKKFSQEDVVRARKEQIEQETAHARELHSLEMEERKSLYALKRLQMRELITQQRQLFQAQLNKINSF